MRPSIQRSAIVCQSTFSHHFRALNRRRLPISSVNRRAPRLYRNQRIFNSSSATGVVPSPLIPQLDISQLWLTPKQFQYLCYAAGIGLSISALYLLQEKLIFGTVAGIVCKTGTAPFERLSTYRQASFAANYSVKEIVSRILRREGILGLWRGNFLNVFRASFQRGFLFSVNDFIKSSLGNVMEDSKRNKHIQSFVAGVMGGWISTFLTYPLDIAKNVNQARIYRNPWPSHMIWYRLWAANGIKGPFVALIPTLIHMSMYHGIVFWTFDTCREKVKEWNTSTYVEFPSETQTSMNDVSEIDPITASQLLQNASNNTNTLRIDAIPTSTPTLQPIAKKWSPDAEKAIAGALAGSLGSLVMYPNQCIRKRMQTAHVSKAVATVEGKVAIEMEWEGVRRRIKTGTDIFPHNWRNTGLDLIRNEGGIIRLYNGFSINLIRAPPSAALQFFTYHSLKEMYESYTQLN